jgi:hypothetical protein
VTISRTARLPMAMVAVLVGLVVLALPAAVAGVVPSAVPGACASAEGQVQVTLVVDFGTVDAVAGRPANTSDCLAIGSDGNGVTLLAQRFGTSGVRINGSGLICAIDGYPATGCGDHQPNGSYRYWSYWKGGSEWIYSPVGPAYRRFSGSEDSRVDGWRFVEGAANPNDPQPKAAATGICAPSDSSAPPVTGPPAGSGAGGSGSGGSGTGRGGSAAGSGAAGGGVTSTSAGSNADPSTPAGASDQLDGAATDPTGDVAASETTEPSTGDTMASSEQAAAVGGGPSSSGIPVIAIAVGVAVLALGGGAAVRFRAKSDT